MSLQEAVEELLEAIWETNGIINKADYSGGTPSKKALLERHYVINGLSLAVHNALQDLRVGDRLTDEPTTSDIERIHSALRLHGDDLNELAARVASLERRVPPSYGPYEPMNIWCSK